MKKKVTKKKQVKSKKKKDLPKKIKDDKIDIGSNFDLEKETKIDY